MSIDKQFSGGLISREIYRNSLTLGLFALLTVGLVSFTWLATKERIAIQIRQSEQKALIEVLPAGQFDHNLLDTTLIPPEPEQLGPIGENARIWVASKNGRPTAMILPVVAPDGYNGRIRLLVGINLNGIITGVRVVSHKETPGLGNGIETKVSNWIIGFNGRSLGNSAADDWAVKKDGGEFDQFTGATITPRAVVGAVYRALGWFTQHRSLLIAEAAKSLNTETTCNQQAMLTPKNQH